MTIDENGTITIYNGDYGMPIVFETVDFAVGDKVVFVISNNPIPPKEFTVDADGYTFDLIFDQTEAINIAAAVRRRRAAINYSFKQYRDGAFLDTIANGKIRVRLRLMITTISLTSPKSTVTSLSVINRLMTSDYKAN